MGIEDNDQVITRCHANENKQSLLQKFDIPIEHLSYDYIGECKNGKELERIVRILRSGEEGSFPHLTNTAEARLSSIKPDSVLLRSAAPVASRANLGAQERRELDAELSGWLGEMQLLERDLQDEGSVESLPLSRPAVRLASSAIGDRRSKLSACASKERRLSSCDYAGWDKYDADTELERIELLEEQCRAEARRQQQQQQLQAVTELEQRRTDKIVNKSLLTPTEQHVLGIRDREKGNEAYRAGDYTEALRLYNASVLLAGDIDACNNRAMTHIKLNNYKEAIKDCDTVLEADSGNVKALLRRAFALEKLDRLEEALKNYEKVLRLDPGNITAVSSIKKLRKDDSEKVRPTIEEIHDDD